MVVGCWLLVVGWYCSCSFVSLCLRLLVSFFLSSFVCFVCLSFWDAVAVADVATVFVWLFVVVVCLLACLAYLRACLFVCLFGVVVLLALVLLVADG